MPLLIISSFKNSTTFSISLTIFGHFSNDVGYFRGARRLWVEQRKKIMKNVHLLDLHAGLRVYRRKHTQPSLEGEVFFTPSKEESKSVRIIAI